MGDWSLSAAYSPRWIHGPLVIRGIVEAGERTRTFLLLHFLLEGVLEVPGWPLWEALWLNGQFGQIWPRALRIV